MKQLTNELNDLGLILESFNGKDNMYRVRKPHLANTLLAFSLNAIMPFIVVSRINKPLYTQVQLEGALKAVNSFAKGAGAPAEKDYRIPERLTDAELDTALRNLNAQHAGKSYRHVKTGNDYFALHTVVMNQNGGAEFGLVYITKNRSQAVHVRPLREFLDGRFQLIDEQRGDSNCGCMIHAQIF